MAGIGIKLNRIFQKHTLASTLYGSAYSMLATITPMLVVIGTLVLMYVILGFQYVGYYDRELFSCTVLYVFIFSLLCASPFNSVLSKYVGDRIFEERYEDILPCVYVGMALQMLLAATLGIPFCIWGVVVGKIPLYYMCTGFCAFMALGLCFCQMLYLSILKVYKKISLFFFLGMAVCFVLALALHFLLGVSVTYSMLAGLTVGLFVTACLEHGFIKTYFSKNSHHYREIFRYFRVYWKLVFSNFFFILGLFCHNFVFWTREDMRLVLADTYVCNQPYDMASCIAMFTNISASVIFIAYVEMHFRERYKEYNEAILGGRLKDIEKTKKRMFRLIADQLMRITQLQYIISVVVFLLCLIFLPRFGMSGMVMTIYPSLAAGYFILFLCYSLILLLQYFNDLTGTVLTAGVFCLGVFLGSLAAKNLPDYWYGIGVFTGSLAAWTVGYFRLRWVEKNIDGHIFCRGSLLDREEQIMPDAKVYDVRAKKKKILFVMNTMGRAGAEKALIQMLWALNSAKYEVSLLVLLPRGEMFSELPEHVRVLNKNPDSRSVLSTGGSMYVMGRLIRCALRPGVLKKALGKLLRLRGISDKQERHKKREKIMRRMLADGTPARKERYDMAVAYLEGPATWYVAQKVKAGKKAAFLHVDYDRAGYDQELDENCYEAFDRIYAVSEEVKAGFLKNYPQYQMRTELFFNMINRDRILHLSQERGGFKDDWEGYRILTVGRLYHQKGYDIAIEAASILEQKGYRFRWYVLGDGEEKAKLKRQIRDALLMDTFFLLGAVENPYPYFRQADLYVCSSRFEGKSIVIEEAQILGKPMVASHCTGITEQVRDGEDALIAEQGAEHLAEKIAWMMDHPQEAEAMGRAAAEKERPYERGLQSFLDLLGE